MSRPKAPTSVIDNPGEILKLTQRDKIELEPLPIIYVKGGSLAANVKQIETHLGTATLGTPALGIYQQGGRLVHIVRLGKTLDKNGLTTPAGTLQILPATPNLLRSRFADAAQFVKYAKREKEWFPTDPSTDIASSLLDTIGRWPNTPHLSGIVRAPALRSDGTVLQDTGYDPESGLYFDADGAFPQIPAAPSRSDAEAALALLRSVIDGFPYVDEPSRAVMLAAMITPLCRHAMRSAPLFGFSAPAAGSGKTLQSYIPSYIATGLLPQLFSLPGSEEEAQKRYLGMLSEGGSVIVIDNVERPLKDAALCTILTEPSWSERLLGQNKTLTVSTAVTWIATGNALSVDGDLSSRTLLSSIDAEVEQPEERVFNVNLHESVPQQRRALAAAALTIVRAYIAADRPEKNIRPYGRFEGWSKIVREPLIWLGCADPCDTRNTVRARDTEREDLSALLESWHEMFGSYPKTTDEVVKELSGLMDANLIIDERTKVSALHSACHAVSGDGKHISIRKLGNYIRSAKMRILEGFRFEHAGDKSHRALWRVNDLRKR